MNHLIIATSDIPTAGHRSDWAKLIILINTINKLHYDSLILLFQYLHKYVQSNTTVVKETP